MGATPAILILTVLLLCLPPTPTFAFRRSKHPWGHNPLVKPRDHRMIRGITNVRKDVIENGCDTNLCFALDGSSSISHEEYQEQINFVDLIISITATDTPANYCAVQYHRRKTPISRLTGNQPKFLEKLHRSRLPPYGGTNIAAGLKFAARQLRRRFGDANKIIVLGDGFHTIGRNPRRIAERFRRRGGAICAVAVGPTDMNSLVQITGDYGRIVNIDGFFELSEIVVSVVRDVCDLPASDIIPDPDVDFPPTPPNSTDTAPPPTTPDVDAPSTPPNTTDTTPPPTTPDVDAPSTPPNSTDTAPPPTTPDVDAPSTPPNSTDTTPPPTTPDVDAPSTPPNFTDTTLPPMTPDVDAPSTPPNSTDSAPGPTTPDVDTPSTPPNSTDTTVPPTTPDVDTPSSPPNSTDSAPGPTTPDVGVPEVVATPTPNVDGPEIQTPDFEGTAVGLEP